MYIVHCKFQMVSSVTRTYLPNEETQLEKSDLIKIKSDHWMMITDHWSGWTKERVDWRKRNRQQFPICSQWIFLKRKIWAVCKITGKNSLTRASHAGRKVNCTPDFLFVRPAKGRQVHIKRINSILFIYAMPERKHFYRTQVSLGSDLWVRLSLTKWETFCRLNWCESGWWRYKLNTNW